MARLCVELELFGEEFDYYLGVLSLWCLHKRRYTAIYALSLELVVDPCHSQHLIEE